MTINGPNTCTFELGAFHSDKITEISVRVQMDWEESPKHLQKFRKLRCSCNQNRKSNGKENPLGWGGGELSTVFLRKNDKQSLNTRRRLDTGVPKMIVKSGDEMLVKFRPDYRRI